MNENDLLTEIHYTRSEEHWNSWSHAAGIVLGVTFGAMALPRCVESGSTGAVIGMVLYLVGMLASYVSSTVYHATPSQSRRREPLRQCDHAAIYWHIAGSYSPIALIALRQEAYWGIGLFVWAWACALVGTVFALRGLKAHSHLETVCFVGMGLSVLVALRPLLHAVSAWTLGWIVAEGVCYITGALFYSLHRRRYMHTVFHFFVLGGTLCHMMAVWLMLDECLV